MRDSENQNEPRAKFDLEEIGANQNVMGWLVVIACFLILGSIFSGS